MKGHSDPLLCLVSTGENNGTQTMETGITGASISHPQEVNYPYTIA